MRRLAVVLIGLLVGLACSGCCDSKPTSRQERVPTESVLLRGVRIVDVEAGVVTDPCDILIEDGRVAAIDRCESRVPASRQFDCTGKYAVPGLFDCHTHLVHLTGKGDEELAARLGAFLDRGVTQVRDVGGPIECLSSLSRRVAGGELRGPEVFFSGPMLESNPLQFDYVNEEYPGFTVAIDSAADADRLLPELARQGACMVKTFNRIDPAVYRHLTKVARRCGLGIVHDPGMPLFHQVPMDVALDLGVTSIEHAKSPWPVVLRDDLWEEHDRLMAAGADEMQRMMFMMRVMTLGTESIDRERLSALAEKMKERGAYLCPTLEVFASMEEIAVEQLKRRQHMTEVPDMMRAGIRQTVAAMEQVSRLFMSEFVRAGVKLLVGQDGGEANGTLSEMRRMRDIGVSNIEILRGATIYPATWLGVQDRLGTIAPNRQGNIAVLDGNPLDDLDCLESPFLVLQRGCVVAGHQ